MENLELRRKKKQQEQTLTRLSMEELELRRERVSPLPRRLQYDLLLRHLKTIDIKNESNSAPRRLQYLPLAPPPDHFQFFLFLFQSPSTLTSKFSYSFIFYFHIFFG
jgi:hypothetical protein